MRSWTATRLKFFAEADPSKLPWGELGWSMVGRVHGQTTAGQDAGPPGRRRQRSHPLRPGQGGGRHLA
ncbi:hypothetical protein QJS66_02865 [Kocuria rhizophila]|nr:hypothetical protein QJS66_02865 [Kocuria rhizophila]